MTAGRVIRSFSTPGDNCYGIDFDGARLWISSYIESKIYCVDIVSGKVIHSISYNGTGIAVGTDRNTLWACDYAGQAIEQLSFSGTVLCSFSSPGAEPIEMTALGGRLWNTDRGTGILYELDPETGQLIRSFSLPAAPISAAAVTFDGHFLYVSSDTTALIYKVDPISGRVINSFSSPSIIPAGLAYDGHTLWHTDLWTELVYQLAIN